MSKKSSSRLELKGQENKRVLKLYLTPKRKKTQNMKNQVAADQSADGGNIATSSQHNKGLHKETQV
ncbi:hypothetical protein KY285_010583 [Solanum tuberosum]|nr:hypothetical protein KY285_037421 [Solanum tuberosum]KAH0682770.1 hypothetical protein KY289_020522 [Solanum tuberosum]KAH0689039.1 hypothetical protein KY289_016397 [Solanum tuberosum]KAH0693183.1 hypothetical protein KY285_020280 [Solanum tuberosum]KAH0701907.1 hypothetical protein KY285_016185 [Solanum tuberosum]